MSALVQGHTSFGCLGVTGTRPGVPSPPTVPPRKPPISPCPPILCWLGDPVPPLGPDASGVAAPRGTDTLSISLGGLMRGGRAGTCRVPPPGPSAPRGFALPAQEPSQPWEHPALGCQLVLLQDPALGSVTCWGSLPGPSAQDKGLFRAGASLCLSTPGTHRDGGMRGLSSAQ